MGKGTVRFGVDHATPKLEPNEAKHVAPIVSSYNERIRPVLDAVENLRRLNITKEGIQLPTIVVVGDQSSGKSSVLESLAGISLPRGQGICTRVPLIMRLQNHSLPKPELVLEYNAKIVSTDEAQVSDAIRVATDELAGGGKGISNTPLTLVVKKDGVPDLTMVDLPGITRVPVHGQPEDIYDQIKDIIMEYIRPEESIILNVLSATVEKVTADDVNIGLGYVCVRNRIGDESYEDARAEEANLFRTHTLLSKIDKPIVGVPVLAQKLVLLQAASISKILPEIVKKINDKLGSQLSELDKFPRKLTYGANAMSAFMHIIGLAKESLSKILLSGEFDEYPDDKHICTVPLLSSLTSFGLVQVSHLIEYQTLLPEAFDLKMRLTAYWKIVLRRLIDSTALHLQFRIFNPVKKDVGYEIVKDVMSQCGGGIQRLLKESPSVALNRDKLNRSIKVLRESKKVVASITDKVSSYGN
ncbi:Dynamin-related protein 4C [Glycine max]|nr:Dynamin-related protein 4C [Glycine max]